jgi:hypothetical protein
MSRLIALLRAAPFLKQLLVALGIVAMLGTALGGLYAFVRHQGYEAGRADAEATCAREKAAQEEANRRAIADALDALLVAVDGINQKQTEIDDVLAGIDEAVAADPDGAVVCLDADSVRRLGTIR